MQFIDKIILGASGFLSLAIIWVFIRQYEEEKKGLNFFYIIGFAINLSSSILVIFFNWIVFNQTLVSIFAILIPFTFSIGLTIEYFKKLTLPTIILSITGVVSMVLFYYLQLSWLQNLSYLTVIISLLQLIILPFLASKKASKGFWWVGFGGILSLILFGLLYLYLNQITFYFLVPPITEAILCPVYSLATISVFWGFMQGDDEKTTSADDILSEKTSG